MSEYKYLLAAAGFVPRSCCHPYGWVGHIPFSFWLIQEFKPKVFVELGTHSGNSYFAFCQAILEAGLEAKCHAVDTWAGDDHAGHYDRNVFENVDRHNQENYSNFSTLMKMRFDEALPSFENGEIDLLHIDGLHTYDAVKHDFESWLPKLAPGAIVLLHDTAVRERGFGVLKFWEELKDIYPLHLEFEHSHGLGVLQLNNPPKQKILSWLRDDAESHRPLIAYFARLGVCLSEHVELERLKASDSTWPNVEAVRSGRSDLEGRGDFCRTIALVAAKDSGVLKKELEGEWYRRQNPDVFQANVAPLEHWLAHGIEEGRLPSQNIEKMIAALLAEREQLLRSDSIRKEKEAFESGERIARDLHELRSTVLEREREFGERMQSAEKAYTKELGRLESEINKHIQLQKQLELELVRREGDLKGSLHAEIENAVRRERELQAQLMAARDECSQYEKTLSRIFSENLVSLSDMSKKFAYELGELRDGLNRLVEEVAEKERIIYELSEGITAMRLSASWRWTAPLRAISKMFRK